MAFKKEKQQYAEDQAVHEKPWELWQYASPLELQPYTLVDEDALHWYDLHKPPEWAPSCKYRRKTTVFMPKYFSGINWRDAEYLIGKTIEYTNHPDAGWKVGKLKTVSDVIDISHFGIITGQDINYHIYIRTCEKTLKHPTINICGVELPKSETVKPKYESKYWVAPTGNLHTWADFSYDELVLKSGQVHLTEERAKAWADWWKKTVLNKIK